MALATGTIFHQSASATTGNVNGSGFNPANPNMLTDLTTNTNTANTASPIVSSGSYNFVAGDVGNWLYIQSGTNWTPGWYQIASVAANKATLSAAVGAAQIISLGFKAASTVIGCATVGTPTNGVFAIDYSQTDTATVNAVSDFTAVGTSVNLLSASSPFTPVMVGNYYHQTTTGTGAFGIVGWYEIISFSSVTTVALDRTPNTGTQNVNCTGYVGGAGRLNALEDAFYEMLPAGANVWIKGGTYTFTGAIAVASTNGTAANPIFSIGFSSLPGDDPRTTGRPTFSQGANAFTAGSYQNFYNIMQTGTPTTVFTVDVGTSIIKYCKFVNTSTTANRAAFNSGTQTHYFNEMISQNGNACSGTTPRFVGSYLHDSQNAFSAASNSISLSDSIIASCQVSGLTTSSATGLGAISGNTFYGRSVTPTGIAINFTAAAVSNRISNNIISGWATGVLFTTTNSMSNNGAYNDFFNNTTDVTLYTKDKTDIALDPQFTDIAEISFSTGTITGGTATLTVSGGDFSTIEDNVDYCHITGNTGGTGVFVGIYLIISHTSTTITFNNNAGTSGSATSVTGYIPTGHDYSIGTNLKAQGFPGLFSGSATTQYLDIGGVQRQESGGSAGMLFIPCLQGL